MNYIEYQEAFIEYCGVKKSPNARELAFFEKTTRYGRRITWIP